MSKENLANYASAFEELKGIVESLEKGQISVDELAKQVNRATELVEVCRTKLHGTEQEVIDLLDKLHPQA